MHVIEMVGASNTANKHSFAPTISFSSVLAGQSASIVGGFNSQFNFLSTNLAARQAELNTELAVELIKNPNFSGLRNSGVDLAWRYEKAELEMGGSGTERWTPGEKEQILYSPGHSVSGAEGHHIYDVSHHPDRQVDADNIKFYRSRKEHIRSGHGGDFRNESRGELIDRQGRLAATNRRRIIKQELTAFGISAAIGFSVGFGISLALELSKNEFNLRNVVKSMGNAALSGLKSAGMASISYASVRLLTSRLRIPTTYAASIVGGALLVANAAIGYAKRRMEGWDVRTSLTQTVKGMILPLGSMSVSFVFALVGCPVIGAISALGIGVLATIGSIRKNIKDRKLNDVIDAVVVECNEPHYA